MITNQDLERAVAAGAISSDAASALRRFAAEEALAPMADEEQFRLVSGFNDIFVAIASVLLLVALAWIGGSIGPNFASNGPSPTSGILVAAAAWGLAEVFTRQRRMALPSILLLLAFAGGVFESVFAGLGPLVGDQVDNRTIALVTAASAAVAAAAAWAHWRRFRVPITIAAGAAAIAGLALSLLASAIGGGQIGTQIMSLALAVCGLAVFAFAMRWDMSDLERVTRRSDVAFWLHLLAAPLIVHPVFTLLGVLDNEFAASSAPIVLLLYVALAGVALAIDRRALMVSALAYVLYALSALFRELGAVSLNVALTALVIGSALLLLSAYWHNVRALVVGWLPDSLQARLPSTQPIVARPALSRP